MSQTDQKIDALSEMLAGFIDYQKDVNARVEKKLTDLDTKIDRIEYRLESQIAAQMEVLFEEMKEVSDVVQKQEDEVIQIRYDFSKLRKDVRELQTA